MRLDDTQQACELQISIYEEARVRYAEHCRQEMALEAERALVKAAAIQRLMANVNPTSKDGKLHSATSAEAVVASDPEYAEHLARQRQAVWAKLSTETEADAAKLRAHLALATLKALAGVA